MIQTFQTGAWVRGAPHVKIMPKHIKIMITLRFHWYRSLLSPVSKVCILQPRSWVRYFDVPNIIYSKFSKSWAHNLKTFQSGTQNTAGKLTWAQLSCQSLMSQHFRLYRFNSCYGEAYFSGCPECGSKLRVTLRTFTLVFLNVCEFICVILNRINC